MAFGRSGLSLKSTIGSTNIQSTDLNTTSFQAGGPSSHHAEQQQKAYDTTYGEIVSAAASVAETNPGQAVIFEMAASLWGEAANQHFDNGEGSASAYIESQLGDMYYAINETIEEMDSLLTFFAGSLWNGVHGIGQYR